LREKRGEEKGTKTVEMKGKKKKKGRTEEGKGKKKNREREREDNKTMYFTLGKAYLGC
jgi:hypothetical protein